MIATTPKPACAAPFCQMTLQPTGKVSPCCYHYGFELGRVPESTLMDIWNGPQMRQLREEFLSGNPKSCRAKMQYIRCHERFADWLPEVTPSAVQTASPKRLDLRLNGQCNLSCVMCEVWQQPNGVWNESDLWTQGPQQIFPYLREIDVLGGEPFIQADTKKLIEAVYVVNKDCRWSFVTNAQYRLQPDMQRLLELIPLKMLQVSVDSLDADTYKSIRGGDLRLLQKNLSWFLDLRERRQAAGDDFELRLSLCALKSNWREIPAFIDFCHGNEASCELQFAHYDPSKTNSLAYLELDEMEEVIEILKTSVSEKDHHLLHTILEPLNDAIVKKRERAKSVNFTFASPLPPPFAETLDHVWAQFKPLSQFPDVDALNELPGKFSLRWFYDMGLRFVPQPKMGQRKRRSYRKMVQQGKAVTYDGRISQEREIWTRRNNWHDLFAAMIWCAFPRAKFRLHCTAHALATASGRGKNRSEAQDYLTMFDEGGLVVPILASEIDRHVAVIRDLKAEDRLAYLEKEELSLFGFGHGVLEALCLQRQFVNAMTLFVPVAPEFFTPSEMGIHSKVDAALEACFEQHGTNMREYLYMAAVRLNPIP